MANPYDVYRNQRRSAWTRADMVLALYDEALKRIDESTQALGRNDQVESRRHGLRLVQLIACLRSGVDPNAGRLPTDILRLYDFVSRCVMSGTLADLDTARNIIAPLRDSFREIRDAAAEMEASGAIPTLESHVEEGYVA